MLKEKSCGAIVIDENRVLIIQQIQGDFGFPKGHVEKNETEIETAIREVKEETNIDIEVIEKYRYSINYISSENTIKEVVFFIAKPKSNNVVIDPNELIQAHFVPIKDAIEIITYDETKKVFLKAINDLERDNIISSNFII